MTHTIEDVRSYWDSHLNLTQFLTVSEIELGSEEFFLFLETLDRYDYKDPLLCSFSQGCKGQKLLEVGCGLGLELTKLGSLGFDVTGIDLSPQAVNLSRAFLQRKALTGMTKVQNAEQLDFADHSFDAVYSSGVLQHTPNIEKAINEIWRVLKPGGKILIILYHKRSWFYLAHKLSGANIEFESEDAPIINSYTRREMRDLFSDFKNVDVMCEYYRPTPTRRRGILPFLYNKIFVSSMGLMPQRLIRNFGWHLVLTATK